MNQSRLTSNAARDHRLRSERGWLTLQGPSRILLIVLVSSGAGWVHADSVFNVNTVADLIDDDISDGVCHTTEGTCSLRAAIMQSNHPGRGTMIIHVPAGTYLITLPAGSVNDETNGDFNFNSPGGPNQTFLLGAGPGQSIVDGNGLDNVFYVQPVRTVTIDGMTIRNGVTPDNGGGINSQGLLSVTHCMIEDNQAADSGGGIYSGTSSGASLTLIDTLVHANSARLGGGIYTRSPITLRNSAIDRNMAVDSGGGIYNDGQLTITNSTISTNAANTNGGGIYSSTAAFIDSSSIVDNDADHDRDELGGIGGGIFARAGSRFVATNTLFARNTIDDAPLPDN